MSVNLAPEQPAVQRAIQFGLTLIILFFGGFGAWATFAPLQSAAIAPGSVVVEGNRRIVQHLEGGIVAELHVRDGDTVVEGDTLITLETTLSTSNVSRLRSRVDDTTALIARLRAEQTNAEELSFPASLMARRSEPNVLLAIETQLSAFQSRRDSLATETAVLTQIKAQLAEEISGLRQQIIAQNKQLELIEDELLGVRSLLAAGLERRPRFLALEREKSEIVENRAGRVSSIARAEQSIGETDLRILDLQQVRRNEAIEQLSAAQSELADLSERLAAAKDIQQRTTLRAPADGVVVGMTVFTPGAVIAPGAPILDVVPQDVRLIIEARVNPIDIDTVKTGLEAQVRLTAFNQRVTPTLDGTVITVSADLLQDQRTGQSYYLARISLDDDQPELAEFTLYPGMPAEVSIITGAATTLDYLLKPLLASFNRGMREN